MKRVILLLLIIFLLLLTGCRTDKKSSEEIGIRGIVKDISVQDEQTASLLVEGDIEEDTFYDKASVRIDSKTEIKGNTNSKLSIEDIAVGDLVEVIFHGPVAESYPVQGNAGLIRIVSKE